LVQVSGSPLGKPIEDAQKLKEQRRLKYQDEIDRIAVEGKFGHGKRRFSLALIMTKLAQTSEVAIKVSFIVMNLEKILSGLISFLLFVWCWLFVRFQVATMNYRNHNRQLIKVCA
jgi:transposase, IS5 family